MIKVLNSNALIPKADTIKDNIIEYFNFISGNFSNIYIKINFKFFLKLIYYI